MKDKDKKNISFFLNSKNNSALPQSSRAQSRDLTPEDAPRTPPLQPLRACGRNDKNKNQTTDKRRKQRPNRHGWTRKRRAQQAARARKTKPWKNATGPKTGAGKKTVARNAYKHGFRSQDYRELCRLLRRQKEMVNTVLATSCVKTCRKQLQILRERI